MQRRPLIGTYECALDNRFRLAIPARLRDWFTDGAVMAVWFDAGVAIAPRLEWPDLIEAVFGKLTVLDDDQRQLRRYILGNAYEQELLDRQGRLVIPERLREHAALESKVQVVGNGEYLELWNPARLKESYEAVHREGVSTLGKRLVERGR